MRQLIAAAVLMTWSVCPARPADGTRERIAADAERRVRTLNSKFGPLFAPMPGEERLSAACAVNCTHPEVQQGLRSVQAARMTALDDIISQIDAEVDHYVARTVDVTHPDLDRAVVERGLKQILAPAADEPPAAFILDSAKGRSLIVVYALHKGGLMGEHATSVTLRAYSAKGPRLQLVDVEGADMDGYGSVSVKELNSPAPDEKWLLVWGNMTGANGPNVRMRLYAYDGEKFRTTWMPANVWGDFKIRVTERGFTVDGQYYRENRERHETYFFGCDGLYLVFPRY